MTARTDLSAVDMELKSIQSGGVFTVPAGATASGGKFTFSFGEYKREDFADPTTYDTLPHPRLYFDAFLGPPFYATLTPGKTYRLFYTKNTYDKYTKSYVGFDPLKASMTHTMATDIQIAIAGPLEKECVRTEFYDTRKETFDVALTVTKLN